MFGFRGIFFTSPKSKVNVMAIRKVNVSLSVCAATGQTIWAKMMVMGRVGREQKG